MTKAFHFGQSRRMSGRNIGPVANQINRRHIKTVNGMQNRCAQSEVIVRMVPQSCAIPDGEAHVMMGIASRRQIWIDRTMGTHSIPKPAS